MEMQSIRFRGMSCAFIFRTRLAANSTLDIGRSCMLSHDVTPPGNSISKYQQKLVLEHSDDTPWKINMEPNNFPPPLGKEVSTNPNLQTTNFGLQNQPLALQSAIEVSRPWHHTSVPIGRVMILN